MKKILLSLGTLVVVGAVVAGATIAFYNDTETSNGNIFVAGSIDLKVDHEAQTYNGVDCETCSVNVFSSTATNVIAGTGAFAGTYPTPAVELTFIHPAWLAEATLPPAQWIWVTNPVLLADTTNNAEYTFQKKFNWNGSVSGVTLDLALAADNGYKIVFNGIEVANALGTETNYGALVNTTAAEALMLPVIQNGVNTLEITVRNKALGGSNPASNPAGLIFELNIQRANCEADSAFQNACQLWSEQDLDGSQSFFSFGDVKPADSGTNLISLHVGTNDAYACLIPNNIHNDENVVVDPEVTAGDTLVDGLENGELGANLEFFLWEDNGDGVYQNTEPTLAGPGAHIDQIQTQMLAMTLTGGGPTEYVGLAWCAGDQTVSGSVISCDGNGMGNKAQTDKLLASLTAYAVQVRNNPGFTCASVVLP